MPLLRVPEVEEPELLADWLEASLLSLSTRASDADIQDALEEAGWDPNEGRDQLVQLFHLRSLALGANYPFERVGNGFNRRGTWDTFPLYSFLLFVSLNQCYAEMRFAHGTANEPAELFEHVTAAALQSFMGGRAIRMGAPRRNPVPPNFPEAIEYLADQLREPMGARDLENQMSGDDGLDIWLVKNFPDNRPSQVFLIAQCAIGNDWLEKRSDLDVRVWNRHIDWYTEPMRAFAVPFQVSQPSWRETATRGGLIVDRPRIASKISEASFSANLRTRIKKWTRARIKSAAAVLKT